MALEARPSLKLALLAAMSGMILILPDALFYALGYPAMAIWKSESVLLALLFGIVITLIPTAQTRVIALSVVLLSQMLWLGCIAYFGKALAPEQVMLATTEVGDISSGIVDGWRTLRPAMAIVVVTGAALLWLQSRPIERSHLGRLAGTWGLIAVLAGCAGYWVMHKRANVLVPGPHTWSGLGPYHALVGALRLSLSPVTPAQGMRIEDQSVTPVPIPEEPVTVMVIMGEGISPTRLSLFGHKADTSPRLKSWMQSPPTGFELIPKIGFSGGVATLGSVPSFIKMAYVPVDGEWRGKNLFDLAHASGFKTWFFSAQSRHFLDVAGGARNAEHVFAEQGNIDLLTAKKDDTLVDLVASVPPSPTRRFIFVHQRVNHSNYVSHCSHLRPEERKEIYTFSLDQGTTEDRRRAAYDSGLRCWDRNVARLVDALNGKDHATFVFVTADHGQMMGEDGLWGHSMGDMRVTLVPTLLLTNRPNSDIAVRFRKMGNPTSYTLAQLVARALGADVTTTGATPNKFYFNNTMPFGQSGYFEVEALSPMRFKMSHYSKEGKLLERSVRDLPELNAADGAQSPALSNKGS